MRIIIIVLTICLVSCQAMMALEMAPVLDERDKARDKAEQDYKVKLADADKKALTKLSSLAHSAKDADRIEVYKEMLRIDSKNEDAVKYFTALGTLDSVLMNLNKTNDLVAVDNFVMPKTADQWKDIKGVEFKIDPTKACVVPATMGLKAGMRIRIVPHPTESWTAAFTTDPNFATWQTTLMVRTGSGLDAKQFVKVSELPEMVYTVKENDIEFKCTHPDAGKLSGVLRVKFVLIK